MSVEPIDLGHEHTLRFTSWAPDRSIPANAERYAGVPDVERWGAILGHPVGPHPIVPAAQSTGYCEGGLTFDGPVQQQLEPQQPKWTVESWEPLTLSPSVLCACGDHGWVREGRWVPA